MKKAQTMEEFGPKCEDYEPLCIVCQGWRLYTENGGAPTYTQAKKALDQAYTRHSERRGMYEQSSNARSKLGHLS